MITPAQLFELNEEDKANATALEEHIDVAITAQHNANPSLHVFLIPLPTYVPTAKVVGHVLAKYRKGDETVGKSSQWGAEVTAEGFKLTKPSQSHKGRPKMTEEQKTAAKAAREAAKVAAPAVTTPPVVATSPEIAVAAA